jgi:hypothetical protein
MKNIEISLARGAIHLCRVLKLAHASWRCELITYKR